MRVAAQTIDATQKKERELLALKQKEVAFEFQKTIVEETNNAKDEEIQQLRAEADKRNEEAEKVKSELLEQLRAKNEEIANKTSANAVGFDEEE